MAFPLAGIEESHSHNLALLIPDYNVIIGHIGIISMTGLLKVNIKDIGQLIIIYPDILLGYIRFLYGRF